MSAASFYFRGTHGQAKEHLRGSYPATRTGVPDHSKTGNFRGSMAVTSVTGKGQSALVDGVIKVDTVADNVRKTSENFWKKVERDSKITFIVTLIVSSIGLAAAAVIGSVMPPLFPIALAIGTVALAILGFSILAAVRMGQARRHARPWKQDQQNIQDLLQKRSALAGTDFQHHLRIGAKGTLSTQAEVQQLWETGMQEDATRLAKGVEITDIRKFFNSSFLGDEELTYAFEGNIPPFIEVHAKPRYTFLQTQYQGVRTWYEEQREQINAQAQASHRNNDALRNEYLAPYLQARETARAPVLTERQNLQNKKAEISLRLRELSTEKTALELKQTLAGDTVIVTSTTHAARAPRPSVLGRSRRGAPPVVRRETTVAVSGLTTLETMHLGAIQSEQSTLKGKREKYVRRLNENQRVLNHIDAKYKDDTKHIRAAHARQKASIELWHDANSNEATFNEDQVLMQRLAEPVGAFCAGYVAGSF